MGTASNCYGNEDAIKFETINGQFVNKVLE